MERTSGSFTMAAYPMNKMWRGTHTESEAVDVEKPLREALAEITANVE